jgi:alkylated DNA repair dioxygenase AlkB
MSKATAQKEYENRVRRFYLSDKSWVENVELPKHLNDECVPFEDLWELHPEDFGHVKIFGKVVETPRWQQSYGRGYNFSGMYHDGLRIPKFIHSYMDWANSLGMGKFNQIFLNWYGSGHHYIGSHQDDETQLVNDSPIISISRGATRVFRLRHKKLIIRDLLLKDGTVVVMGGKFQKEFHHEVPKIAGEKGNNVGRRINITLRQFKD